MAFLALLLMSLYEPEELSGNRACSLHPLKPRPWVDNEYIRYAADMNVALAYYNALDDYTDEGKTFSKARKTALGYLTGTKFVLSFPSARRNIIFSSSSASIGFER